MRTRRRDGSGPSSGIRGREAEPYAANRRDVPRAGRFVLDLLPQPRDVDVEGLRRAEPVRIPDLVHDLLASDDLSGAGHQQLQEVELLGGELDRLAVSRDGARGRIQR